MSKKLKIAYIAAGAAGMYCGSCFRDNSLVKALIQDGHQAILIPTYTPLRTDEDGVAIDRVFYNGVSVYLQQKYRFFRNKTPLMDRLLDSRFVTNRLAKVNASTDAKDLGAMTVSMLRGEEGNQKKELLKLVEWLRDDYKPQIVQITNSMFAGLAKLIKEELKVPVLCAMQGEDIFLEDLVEPFKSEALQLLREKSADIDGFIATSRYYADFMTDYLAVPAHKIHPVRLGINPEGYADNTDTGGSNDRLTVGYLARICPEKGLHHLIDGFAEVVKILGKDKVQLKAAGYLGQRDQDYFKSIQKQVKRLGLEENFEYLGEVSRTEKIEFLKSLDVFSVPTVYREPKGLFLLEAMASGVSVVQPDHGAFPEVINDTGGGILVRPNSATALAEGLLQLLNDPELRRRHGSQGKTAVLNNYTHLAMARESIAVYQEYLNVAESGEAQKNADTTREDAMAAPIATAGNFNIRLENIQKTFGANGNSVAVLKGINLKLAAGEDMVIVGPSGSGKSTLLHLIGTLDQPNAGTLEINGKTPFTLSEPELARFRNRMMGFIFQDHHLLPQYTVLENVLMPTRAFKDGDSNAAAERAASLIDRVGLSHRITHLPSELSGGERQRVAIARALINQPRLLLCDEPTGNLDHRTADGITDLLFELHREAENILIVVTHNLELAKRFSRKISLKDGLAVSG